MSVEIFSRWQIMQMYRPVSSFSNVALCLLFPMSILLKKKSSGSGVLYYSKEVCCFEKLSSDKQMLANSLSIYGCHMATIETFLYFDNHYYQYVIIVA